MAFWCMSFIKKIMLDFEIFSFVSLSMECSCMTPLTPAVMVMRGLVLHPLFCIVLLMGHMWCVFVRWLVHEIHHGSM